MKLFYILVYLPFMRIYVDLCMRYATVRLYSAISDPIRSHYIRLFQRISHDLALFVSILRTVVYHCLQKPTKANESIPAGVIKWKIL